MLDCPLIFQENTDLHVFKFIFALIVICTACTKHILCDLCMV